MEGDERNVTVVGNRRFIGTVMAIWSTFNDVSDFAGRVNNVDGFISNVKKWIGIGDEAPEPATAEQIQEIKQQITELEDDIAGTNLRVYVICL